MNQSKTYFLFRHGLATHSKYGYGKKILSASILPEGVPAVERIAERLKEVSTSANISSEITRCKETSAIITRITGKEFSFDKRLNEKYHESIGQIRERVQDFLQDVSQLPQQNVVICTHGTIIAAIQNLVLQGKFVTRHLSDYPQTGELVIIEGGRARIINFN